MLREVLSSVNWDHPLTQRFASADACKLLFKYSLEENNPTGFYTGMRVAQQVRLSNYIRFGTDARLVIKGSPFIYER